MRITRIEVENFLSFERLILEDFDASLNAIVGPNGAGKTNLFRAFRVVRDGLDLETRDIWTKAKRVGSQEEEFRVRIDFELTHESEKQFLTTFIQAALSTQADVPDNLLERHLAWVKTNPSAIEGMFAGTLRVACLPREHSWWKIAYEFEHEKAKYVWVLDGFTRVGVGRADEDIAHLPGRPPLGNLIEHGMTEQVRTQRLEALYSRPLKGSDFFPGGGHFVDRLEASTQWVRGGPLPDSVQRFLDLMGGRAGEPRVYSGLQVFERLFRRALVLIEDLRLPPREDWSADDMVRAPDAIALSDAGNLPLFLFRLKNGSGEDRARFRATQDSFRKLLGRPFDVRSEPILDRATTGEPKRTRSQLVLITIGDEEIPVRFAGAGLWEGLVLSTLLRTPNEPILCVDEPALNLHPTLQRRVLQMIQARRGQSFLITHSPYLIPVRDEQDLTRIFRFYLQDGRTHVARLASQVGEDRERWSRWLKELRRGIDMPALLFAQGVILVEGETEIGALQLWFARSEPAAKSGNLEDLNLVLYWVGGAQNFWNYTEFLTGFSVPWAVVCDGNQFQESQFCRVFGLPVPEERTAFEQMKTKAEALGVFTLSEDFGEFENLSFVAPHLQEAQQAVGTSKARQGRYIAEKVDCPAPVGALYQKILKSVGVL
jgi:hypothetical protein